MFRQWRLLKQTSGAEAVKTNFKIKAQPHLQSCVDGYQRSNGDLLRVFELPPLCRSRGGSLLKTVNYTSGLEVESRWRLLTADKQCRRNFCGEVYTKQTFPQSVKSIKGYENNQLRQNNCKQL